MGDLYTHVPPEAEGEATVRIDAGTRADHDVPAELFGKFGEHLYHPENVENVLEAQVLFNPTFGAWEFLDRTYEEDGGRGGISDPEEIDDRIGEYADAHDLPDADRLRDAYHDGTALWWFPSGDVRASPEVGTAGDRAQRVEVAEGAERAGLGQWCYLPLHRTREFEGRVTLRAREGAEVRVALHGAADDGTLGEPIAAATVDATGEYRTAEFDLGVPASAPDDPDALYGISLTAAGGANLVLDRLLLYPDDHVATADPEVIDLLAGIDLPVLRWPGGNFASGYRWEDGVGPVEERPTRPNPAWDGIETNLFGTAEFIEFCEAVGCEPVICVNAGDGTPAEAAAWVEYCNGATDTEMGALRAEHGHPEPFGVEYWEIGNELYGEWQKTWTTAGGNADRYERFRAAMTAADPSIEVMACGNRLTDWNEPLLDAMADGDWLTDHVLVECHADAATDPVELFNAHSGFAAQLGDEYRTVAEECRAAGIDPKLAITELQLFTRFDDEEAVEDPGLSAETLPGSHSIAEVIFDATVLDQCIRDGFVRMVTHSGVGNHGGGVRKHKGRVWADPCAHGLSITRGLAGGTPVGVEVVCGTFSTDTTFGADTLEWFGELRPVDDAPAVDAMAVAGGEAGNVLVLVHRDAGAGAIEVAVDHGGFFEGEDVTVTTLSAETMHAENTIDEPDRIAPVTGEVPADDLTVTLPRYGLVAIADR